MVFCLILDCFLAYHDNHDVALKQEEPRI